MNKKFVYQVGNNKKVILWCTANQISSVLVLAYPLSTNQLDIHGSVHHDIVIYENDQQGATV